MLTMTKIFLYFFIKYSSLISSLYLLALSAGPNMTAELRLRPVMRLSLQLFFFVCLFFFAVKTDTNTLFQKIIFILRGKGKPKTLLFDKGRLYLT